jgi:hypothetical protein
MSIELIELGVDLLGFPRQGQTRQHDEEQETGEAKRRDGPGPESQVTHELVHAFLRVLLTGEFRHPANT